MCDWRYTALKGDYEVVEQMLSVNRLLVLDDGLKGCHSIYESEAGIWYWHHWEKIPSYRYFFEDDGHKIDLSDHCTKFNLDISMGCGVFDILKLMENDFPRWVYMGYQ